ncbi:pumilio [Salix suchowensis]|nr:pumilio [Salix suchowensis]
MGRKAKKESFGFDAGNSNKRSVSERVNDGAKKPKLWSKNQNTSSEPQPSLPFFGCGKQLDPETTECFLEISNLFESYGNGLEERPTICRYAIEEARGKEFELVTDYYINHYLPNLTSFMVFPLISMNRSGSHAAETALKSLAMHLQYDEACFAIEETLTGICKVLFRSLCENLVYPHHQQGFPGLLKLLIILVLLCCRKEKLTEGNLIEMTTVDYIVMLAVSRESLYDIHNFFRKSLFELSPSLWEFRCSSLRNRQICRNLVQNSGIFEMGKSGVIASLIATSQRLHTYEHEDKHIWKRPSGAKIRFWGYMVLQAVFKFQNSNSYNLISRTILTSMEVDHVFEAARDTGGARTIKAFLDSKASGKQDHRIINKLQGHSGELAMHPSGSYTVEKCFSASNLLLKRGHTCQDKTSPYLLRKLDIDGLQPDQWRSRQALKQSTYKDFYAAFGSSETISSKNDSFLVDSSKSASLAKELKDVRKEIDHHLASSEKYAKHTG